MAETTTVTATETAEAEVAQVEKKVSAQNRRYLRPREMFAYLLTAFGQKNLNEFVNGNRQFFMISFLGISGKAYGVIMFLEMLYDALDDSISGVIIDRTRTRWGKLRPYLAIATPVWSIAIIMLFTTPSFLATTTAKIVWAVIAIFAHNLGMSYCGVWQILPFDITPNVNERNNLLAAQKFMELFGVMLPALLPVFVDLLPRATDNSVGMQDVYSGYAVIMVIISAATAFYGFYVMRERVPLASREQMKEVSIIESFKIAFKNRPMLVLQLNYFFNGFKGIGASNEKFFWLHNAGALSYSSIAGLFTGIPNFIITPLVPKMIRKFGARNLGIFAGLFGGAAYTLMWIIGYKPFGEWDSGGNIVANLVYMTVMLTICGLPNSVINVVGTILQGDVYDYGEWKYGVRNEALIATVSGYFQKAANAINGLLSGVVISLIGYTAHKDVFGNVVRETDSSILRGFWFIFCVMPALARTLYGVSLIFFNVHGKFKEQILKDLEERRLEAVQKVSAENAPTNTQE
ncbi:MAG: MFS transporter [Candidatus Fimenecus sp.]